MSREFGGIRAGLEDAIAFAQGDKRRGVVHRPRRVDVRRVRTHLGMTQERFAATFGISLGTLRHWERGDRKPRGPALVLLNIVEREPAAALRAIG